MAGTDIAAAAPTRRMRGGRLLWKYAASMIGIVCAASLAIGLIAIWFSSHHHKASLVQIQREQAEAAAAKIGHFVVEIERQLGWMVHLPWSATTLDDRRIDALRLLRQVPAIAELVTLDDSGREQLRISRVAVDVIGSGIDRSNEPLFIETKTNRIFYGPVYLHRDSEPYMTIAVAGSSNDAGVVVANVNLKFIWNVVSEIKVGKSGIAYVANAEGRLIAHPDISLVLRNTDLSALPQFRAAHAGEAASLAGDATDLLGRSVLAAHAAIAPLGWVVLAERPISEAFAPVYSSMLATGIILLGALALAIVATVVLARRMVTPIRALQTGAARIGAGALGHRIEIRTGDELEAVGQQFNDMAARLHDSYSNLERKVEERTHQLELANLAKSRFLAAASHDLRQPLHALNLFLAQLQTESDPAERRRVVTRIDTAIAAMNEQFNALLDISKLDAGVLAPSISGFPIQQLLKRVEATFVAVARERGLLLRIVPSRTWVSSDFILLERILLNLISNALRYTVRGGVVVGCRRRAGRLRIEVWDSGIGIAEEQHRRVFDEFYQLAATEPDSRGGLGLGLAIVDRLCLLLDHPVELMSRPGKGSRFAVSVPLVSPLSSAEFSPQAVADNTAGRLVVVIDDEPLVLDGMCGLLRGWGCRVVTADSHGAALACLSAQGRPPDLIISDYRLANGATGIQAIERLRGAIQARVPAFLISGDTAPERLREASASGYVLLHKPVLPITLRAAVNQFLAGTEAANPGRAPAEASS